jgi:hypothetical protein
MGLLLSHVMVVGIGKECNDTRDAGELGLGDVCDVGVVVILLSMINLGTSRYLADVDCRGSNGCRQRWRGGCDRGDDVVGSAVDFEDRGETALKTYEKRGSEYWYVKIKLFCVCIYSTKEEVVVDSYQRETASVLNDININPSIQFLSNRAVEILALNKSQAASIKKKGC